MEDWLTEYVKNELLFLKKRNRLANIAYGFIILILIIILTKTI